MGVCIIYLFLDELVLITRMLVFPPIPVTVYAYICTGKSSICVSVYYIYIFILYFVSSFSRHCGMLVIPDIAILHWDT